MADGIAMESGTGVGPSADDRSKNSPVLRIVLSPHTTPEVGHVTTEELWAVDDALLTVLGLR